VTQAEKSDDLSKQFVLNKFEKDLGIAKNHEIFLRDRIHQGESILLDRRIENKIPHKLILLRFRVRCLASRWSLKIRKKIPKSISREVLDKQVISQHRL
jgi:hypothetical protein